MKNPLRIVLILSAGMAIAMCACAFWLGYLLSRKADPIYYNIAWSPTGDDLAVYSGKGNISILNSRLDLTKHMVADPGDGLSLSWDPNDSRLASASIGTVTIWNVDSGQPLTRLVSPVNEELADIWESNATGPVAWSPNGKMIATGGRNKVIQLWNAATFEVLDDLVGHTDFIYAISWSPDSRQLATGSGDGTLRLWDSETKGKSITIHITDSVWSLGWNRDNSTLAVAATGKNVELWNADTAKLQASLPVSAESLMWSLDGTRLMTIDSPNVYIWDPNLARPIVTFRGHEAGVRSAVWSPDGSKCASIDGDGTLYIWDSSTGTILNKTNLATFDTRQS